MAAVMSAVFAEVTWDLVVGGGQQFRLLCAATPVAIATDANHLSKVMSEIPGGVGIAAYNTGQHP
jgi:hypothetical protein